MPHVFYIGGGGDHIRECRESLQKRQQMTINGLTEHRQVETFTGIVQSLEYLRHNPPDMCWRVTMRDLLLHDDIASTKSLGPDQLKGDKVEPRGS
jgi:hypothetical protein